MGTRAARSFEEEELRRIGAPPPAGETSIGRGGEAVEVAAVVAVVPIGSVGTVTPALVPPAAPAPVLFSIASSTKPSSLLRAEPGPTSGLSPLISTLLILILRNVCVTCFVGVEVVPTVEPVVETVALSAALDDSEASGRLSGGVGIKRGLISIERGRRC